MRERKRRKKGWWRRGFSVVVVLDQNDFWHLFPFLSAARHITPFFFFHLPWGEMWLLEMKSCGTDQSRRSLEMIAKIEGRSVRERERRPPDTLPSTFSSSLPLSFITTRSFDGSLHWLLLLPVWEKRLVWRWSVAIAGWTLPPSPSSSVRADKYDSLYNPLWSLSHPSSFSWGVHCPPPSL